jgi:MFS transporter, PAT family, solute carrier family 33 (acetyl-CoA transportor), member 1
MCNSEEEKSKCKSLGGHCEVLTDGYYSVSIGCFLIGFITLILIIRPYVYKLEDAPESVWRLQDDKNDECVEDEKKDS